MKRCQNNSDPCSSRATVSSKDQRVPWRQLLWGAANESQLRVDIVAKVFLRCRTKILEPLMRFALGDVRDHIASSKIDHGPPSWR
jgi:hypothetical protein